MKAGTTTLMAWHYTTADRLPSIQSSGLLLPATAGIAATERPVTWFSLHPHFEPTALKGLIDPATGRRRTATFEEMLALCGGLARFGMPARALLTGDALRRKARISSAAWRQLCVAGTKCGASPAQWFGFVGPVEVARCTVQHLKPTANAWQAQCMEGGRP